jgi:hypothetical protein
MLRQDLHPPKVIQADAPPVGKLSCLTVTPELENEQLADTLVFTEEVRLSHSCLPVEHERDQQTTPNRVRD